MAEGDDDSERTEEPTSKRIEDALDKGQVAFSREVTSFLFFAFICFFILFLIPLLGKLSLNELGKFIINANEISISKESISGLFISVIVSLAKIILIPAFVILFLVLLSTFMQNGIIFSSEPLLPKLEKISLIAGIKRLFSLRSIIEFIKGFIKISILTYIAYIIIKEDIDKIVYLPELSAISISNYALKISFKLAIAAAIMMFFVAIIDYVYQKYEFLKNLRMTKQELKEEFKQSEGNPEIKAKLKQIRETRARKRMMAQVPKADVVIRNPTHFAVALEYKQEKMNAPKVVALGQDLIALNIIKIAEENKVPVIENRPLAKSLYQTASLDEEIPLEHYKAVAEIIAYVYKLKNKTA
ncbi:MAG TPA: flagellar biosynthesis protein FlhB [Alphaproteobacteria bacterium]|nr:flagellar biosynthesis protein FlhB [Alphaproteobacteria bacterium]